MQTNWNWYSKNIYKLNSNGVEVNIDLCNWLIGFNWWKQYICNDFNTYAFCIHILCLHTTIYWSTKYNGK